MTNSTSILPHEIIAAAHLSVGQCARLPLLGAEPGPAVNNVNKHSLRE